MLTCEKCGKQFIRYKSMIKPGITHFFCSRACAKEHSYPKIFGTHAHRILAEKVIGTHAHRILAEKVIGTHAHRILAEKVIGTHAHRILAEKVIGRPLKKGEVVHHKDGNPRNNLIDNLEVLSSQVEHAKLHCKNGRFS